VLHPVATNADGTLPIILLPAGFRRQIATPHFLYSEPEVSTLSRLRVVTGLKRSFVAAFCGKVRFAHVMRSLSRRGRRTSDLLFPKRAHYQAVLPGKGINRSHSTASL